MRRMGIALVLAMAAGGLGASAAAAQAAPQGPPFPYADCIKATAKKGESAAQGKWHCDQLVQKGWVKPPNR
ncbi:hypothetical protein AB0A77_02845 [Streptomyces varsoviensis]|uniref:hypothetical protein n=1 Tax=Streptomyces varsoviensis TaxID=67373 RepID=UPI0033D138A8